MASRKGSSSKFLDDATRERLKRDLENPEGSSDDEGCWVCYKDDDHANLLLCERCNAEYHTYCLDPPLYSVPAGDWFCAACQHHRHSRRYVLQDENDGLDRLVEAMAPSFTSRFGEICWAQGGQGFGWWPSCIYDPRLTTGDARQLARKHLGKRHLVYFLECHQAPFAVVASSKLSPWYEGLAEDYHLGRSAKAYGKQRAEQFQQALQAATIELGKPIEMRLEWNHDHATTLPSPHKQLKKRKPRNPKTEPAPKRKKRSRSPQPSTPNGATPNGAAKPSRGFPLAGETPQPRLQTQGRKKTGSRRNLAAAMEALRTHSSFKTPNQSDTALYCTILKRNNNGEDSSIGFVQLPSRQDCTFEDARTAIQTELEVDHLEPWNFLAPTLGPVSRKQERSLGSLWQFLQHTTPQSELGAGTMRQPLQVVIVDAPLRSRVETSADGDIV